MTVPTLELSEKSNSLYFDIKGANKAIVLSICNLWKTEKIDLSERYQVSITKGYWHVLKVPLIGGICNHATFTSDKNLVILPYLNVHPLCLKVITNTPIMKREIINMLKCSHG